MNNIPFHENLHSLFTYDVEQNVLRWKVPRRGPKVPHNVAGDSQGYVTYDHIRYRRTHIIHALMTGIWPYRVYARNGNVNDNRLENMRVSVCGSTSESKLRYIWEIICKRLCCARWRQSWPAFKDWALSTQYEEGQVLVIRNTNKPYSPTNSYWLDRQEWQRTLFI